MNIQRLVLLISMGLVISRVSADSLVGVSDPERAKYNWVMHCRGCHQMDASGSQGGAPDMVGIVGQFLQLKEGRAFLGRVPGVAFVALPEGEVAELLNWMVQTFDAEHLPDDFLPYTSEEVIRLRQQPLIAKAANQRRTLLRMLKEFNDSQKNPLAISRRDR